ncbi:hypothetical protein FS827_15095 [Agrobacterium vitis]|nr:hypothetical protein [Allorhizobium ampelinum]
MVAFFIPAATSPEHAEQVYESIRLHISAPANGPRIRALSWRHSGQNMHCEVGSPAPAYYQTGTEPVVAIFDTGNLYFVCTPSRGVLTGGPIHAEKDFQTNVWEFDATKP